MCWYLKIFQQAEDFQVFPEGLSAPLAVGHDFQQKAALLKLCQCW